ncbi:feS assembly SufB domain protein [Mycobacterium xenopi 3993]|nr:feS assembly SufB domain protein [Mycobacterium xenopi 3993]
MTTTPEVRKLDEPLTQQEAIAALGATATAGGLRHRGRQRRRGLSEEVVRDISAKKNEPRWMLENRLKALRIFERKPIPTWGSDLSGIDFDNIKYFVRSTEKQAATWDDLRQTFVIRTTSWNSGSRKAAADCRRGAQYECLAGDTLVWTATRPGRDQGHRVR